MMRPLDALSSIKLKLGVTIVAAVLIGAAMSQIGVRLGWPVWLRPVVATALSLAMVQFLARGMTSPLREMARASGRMADGDYSGQVTATSADEVGQLARAFNAMAETVARTDRMQRDLIANVSHELRTPLSALQARLENIADGVESADRDAVDSMLRQVERLGGLVSDLLDLSRLESGVLELDRTPVSVQSIIEAVLDEARSGSSSIGFTASITPPDLMVEVDAPRIHQVIANLVSNSAQHVGADGTIVVEACRTDRAVEIAVQDDGPGISAEDAPRVFERFYRADQARSAGGGSGLGLAIARWIVDLHGGDLRVDPCVTGARIVVDLPVDTD